MPEHRALACELRLNALSGIGGVQTKQADVHFVHQQVSLNALSGIGGVQTELPLWPSPQAVAWVLMPCRALEAFRQSTTEYVALVGLVAS